MRVIHLILSAEHYVLSPDFPIMERSHQIKTAPLSRAPAKKKNLKAFGIELLAVSDEMGMEEGK